MNSRLVMGIVAGAAAGFAGGWFLKPSNSGSESNTGSVRVAQLEGELKAKTRELERLTKPGGRNASAAKPAAAPDANADTPAYDPKSPEVVKMQEQMKKQMEEKQRLKLDERVAGMKARLGLNDAQTAAIRKLLEENPGGMQSFMALAMSGGDSKEKESEMILELLHPGQKNTELTEKIAAVLTPDQKEAYAAFRQEQRTNQVEIKAGKELARLQSSLTLSPEQKDKAFAVLSTLADDEYENPISPLVTIMAQQLEHPMGNRESKELDPHKDEIKAAAALAAERRQQRVEAMREILSPEQFKLYEDQQKQANVAEFMDSAFDDMPGGMFGFGANVPETEPEPPAPPAPPAPVAPVEERPK
jgi:hypothetical protein